LLVGVNGGGRVCGTRSEIVVVVVTIVCVRGKRKRVRWSLDVWVRFFGARVECGSFCPCGGFSSRSIVLLLSVDAVRFKRLLVPAIRSQGMSPSLALLLRSIFEEVVRGAEQRDAVNDVLP